MPAFDRFQRRLGQYGVASDILQPTHRAVRTDPDLEFDGAVKIHLFRQLGIVRLFTVRNLAFRLSGCAHPNRDQHYAQQNVFQSRHPRVRTVRLMLKSKSQCNLNQPGVPRYESEGCSSRDVPFWVKELCGMGFANCYHEICGENSTLSRETTEQVVLEWQLKAALLKLNPDVPPLALDLALDELTKDRSVLSPVRANREVNKLLKDGIKVTFRTSDDNEAIATVRVIDWEHPANNDFFLASQFWISGEYGRKRADLIRFVNGIPLLFIELKASHKHLENAYKLNLSDYRTTI